MTTRDTSDQAEAASLRAQSSGREAESTIVEAELRNSNTEIAQSTEVVAGLQGQIAEHESRLARAEEKTQSQRAQITRLTTTTSALQERVKQRDLRLANLEAQNQNGRNVIAQMEATVTDLEAKLSDAQKVFQFQLKDWEIQITRRDEEGEKQRAQIGELTGALAEREGQIIAQDTELANVRRELSRQRAEIGELTGALAEREGQIIAQDTELANVRHELSRQRVEIARLTVTAGDLQNQVTGFITSKSWRITAPLRAATTTLKVVWNRLNSYVKLRTEANREFASPRELAYAVDVLKVQGRRIYGWGWMAGAKEIASLKMRVRTTTGEDIPIGCTYGFGREDVAAAHPFFPGAGRSGYVISGWLPDGNIDCLVANVEFSDGSADSFSLGWPITADKVPRFKLLREVIRLARSGDRYLVRGDILGFIRKSKAKLPSLVRGIQSGVAGETDGLLVQLGKTSSHVSLVIDHNMGGGANLYRDRLVTELRQAGKTVFLVCYNLPNLAFDAKFVNSNGERTFRLESPGSLFEAASVIGIKEIFVNDLVSVSDPLSIVDFLPRLRQFSGASLTLAVHDYFMVCPSWTLLDNRGRFCGVPKLSVCRECLPRHEGEFANLVRERDIDGWRKVWLDCLRAADSILCFSHASAQLIQRAYPEIDRAKFLVKPHVLDYAPERVDRSTSQASLHIGIVGEIREHKGARIVHDLARMISKQHLPVRITVIGTIDVSCDSSVVTVTGPYRQVDLARMIADSGVNVCFVPSIWPETFSYVTEELIRLNLPIAVFDLGAPAERVKDYALGLIIKEINAEHALAVLIDFFEKRVAHGDMSESGESRL